MENSISNFQINNTYGIKTVFNLKAVVCFCCFIFLFVGKVYSQQTNFRMCADISMKQKSADSSFQLVIGKVYYDVNFKKTVYEISFPQKETWVIQDTIMYRFSNGKPIGKTSYPNVAEFSIFHLSLKNNLQNFGLDKSPFQMVKTERSGNLVISTWQAPKAMEKYLSYILLSKKDGKLTGVVFKDPQGEVSMKQFFKNYQQIKGFSFPGELTQLNYKNKKETYRITTFKNIVLNENGNEQKYNHPVF